MKWLEIIEESAVDVRDNEPVPDRVPTGFDLKLYHGTDKIFTEFSPFSHFGTEAQARMRNSKYIIPVLVRGRKFKRTRDIGSWPKAKLAQMRALARQGYDGVIYLNRYEGIPLEMFQAAYKQVPLDRLNSLSDRQFKKLVPAAEDSYIIFDPRNIRMAAHESGRRSECRPATGATDRP